MGRREKERGGSASASPRKRLNLRVRGGVAVGERENLEPGFLLTFYNFIFLFLVI